MHTLRAKAGHLTPFQANGFPGARFFLYS